MKSGGWMPLGLRMTKIKWSYGQWVLFKFGRGGFIINICLLWEAIWTTTGLVDMSALVLIPLYKYRG